MVAAKESIPTSLAVNVNELIVFDACWKSNQCVGSWPLFPLPATSIKNGIMPLATEVTILEQERPSGVRTGVNESVVAVIDLDEQNAASKKVNFLWLVCPNVGEAGERYFHSVPLFAHATIVSATTLAHFVVNATTSRYAWGMAPGISVPQLNAWKALLRAHATAVGRIETKLATSGHIPLVEYDVLLELNNAPEGKLRMAELAQRVVLSRSGLTRLVERLEKLGYLQRQAVFGDRRGTQAALTEAGRAALKAAWPVYAKGIGEAFASYLREDDARQLAELLGRIGAGVELET
ncbi:MarR family winged helix-turn-helix transcriptional regulator [Deinococcus sp.]|uniref:MarR family winged helix-turn-helix transcriptional regulator n=1 Tax=Deinococcus sp. TaxID=47478 RepID=UPI003CC55B93